jgi:hypothetical protein
MLAEVRESAGDWNSAPLAGMAGQTSAGPSPILERYRIEVGFGAGRKQKLFIVLALRFEGTARGDMGWEYGRAYVY